MSLGLALGILIGIGWVVVVVCLVVTWVASPTVDEPFPERQSLPADYERMDVRIRHMLLEGFSSFEIYSLLEVSPGRVRHIQEELMRRKAN